MSSDIIYDKSQDGLIITLNKVETYNALNRSMKKELTKIIRKSGLDPTVKFIILKGHEKAFCSGQDLNDRNSKNTNANIEDALTQEWNPLVQSLRDCPKILIGVLHGAVAGAGVSMALNMDLTVAHPSCFFVSGFLKIGLSLDASASFQLVKRMGYQKAMKFSLLSERLKGDDLIKYQLVNEVSDTPEELALEWAKNITNLAPQSVRITKKLLQKAQESTFSDSLERETFTQSFLGRTDNYKEGTLAFLEKRKPQFKNH